MTRTPKIEAIGQLTKTIVIDYKDITSIDIESFFKKVIDDKLFLEDILLAWLEDESTKGTILFPINNYQSQLYIMRKDIPNTYSILIDDKLEEFIFLEELDTIDIKKLKNKEELSGEGKLITYFMLSFEDFNKKYLINPEENFFDMPKNGIILNDVRLVISKSPEISLTGRAAEIAKRKGQ
jgi:hypothetical protein